MIFVGKSSSRLQELLIHQTNAAFTLHDFKPDGANAGIEFLPQVIYVVVVHELDSGHQGHKRIAVFCLSRRSQRTEGASMKRIVHGQHAPAWLASIAACSRMSARPF